MRRRGVLREGQTLTVLEPVQVAQVQPEPRDRRNGDGSYADASEHAAAV